jgi:hypothetical protein
MATERILRFVSPSSLCGERAPLRRETYFKLDLARRKRPVRARMRGAAGAAG